MTALQWAISARFSDYVLAVADGVITCTGGATRAERGTFRFPGVPPCFMGSVRFFAHGGMLDVTIADPWIEVVADAIELSIADPDDDGRLVLARGSVPPIGDRGILRLTPDGSDLFFARYPEGFEIDPWIVIEGATPGNTPLDT